MAKLKAILYWCAIVVFGIVVYLDAPTRLDALFFNELLRCGVD